MKMISSLRGGLLLTSACAVLAACSGSGDVESAGAVAPININIGGGTGGGAATGDGALDFVVAGCPAGTTDDVITFGGVNMGACVIDTDASGVITSDLTLSSGNAYAIAGTVFVGAPLDTSGATPVVAPEVVLTIEPGVVLFGAAGEDALVVSPGSKIEAVGTQNNPIIMTSASDLVDADQGTDVTAIEAASDGLVDGETDARSQWGGLVINGLAPINACALADIGTVNCVKDGEGGSGFFGGIDPMDDSGELKYVRVQYAGFAFSGTDELNGIAFQAVGSDTDVEYIHVHNNKDDGVEFFGGTVDVKHVAVTGAGDDSFDWTDGWTGRAQFVVLAQDPGFTTDPRVIEGDSRSTEANSVAGPRSNPFISNLTILDNTGSADPEDGILLRRGTDATIINAIVSGDGFGNGILYDELTDTAGTPEFRSTYVAGFETAVDDAGFTDLFDAAGSNNIRGDVPLDDIFSITETQAIGAEPVPVDTFFTPVTYIGAFANGEQTFNTSWLSGWALEVEALGGQGGSAGVADGVVDFTTNCPTGTSEAVVTSLGVMMNVCEIDTDVDGVIVSDLTLSAGNVYSINGTAFVGEPLDTSGLNPVVGAEVVLTIDPGVVIIGAAGEDALVVSPGSDISANGTDANPIIMTSASDLADADRPNIDRTAAQAASDGLVNGRTDARSEWGGLVINGLAPINACALADIGTANCVKDGEGGSGFFGGTDPLDDSGNLDYVRVQYAGFAFSGTDELNGIAFQAVGSETDVSHIQVHNNKDDGVEFFGGTVNVSNVVVTGAGDDSFDWTDGWTGNAQFVILRQDVGFTTDPRVIEGDSRSSEANSVAGPRSNPTIANLTLLDETGTVDPEEGILIRRGSGLTMYNSLIVGETSDQASNGNGINFDLLDAVTSPTPVFFSTYVVDFASSFAGDAVDFDTTMAGNNVDGGPLGLDQDSTLTTAAGASVALVPGANEQALTPTALPAGLDAAGSAYAGAVADENDTWYLGWTIGLSN